MGMNDISVEFQDGLGETMTVEDLSGARVEIGPEEYASLESWIGATMGGGGFSPSFYGGTDYFGQSSNSSSSYNQDVAQRADFFNRNEYRSPRNILDEFRLAYDLLQRDDIVGAMGDLTEGMAIQRMKWEIEDIEEEDLWNQIAKDLDLDTRLREMWRELFGMSQFYCAMFWGRKTYNVRGTTDKGNKKRKTFSVKVPLSISILDPTRVLPVGSLLFGKERLAWAGTESEWDAYQDGSDEVLQELVEKKYKPTEEERKIFGLMGIDCDKLLLFKEDCVWRHTLTRPAYKRWADVRLKSVFPLCDLKTNLRQMERAHLVGATNFIVVVTKGSDKLPARQQELNNLDAQVRKLARVPLLVGDHRLNVEIVTPKIDMTLDDKKWDTLDSRIGARCLMSLSVGGDNARQDSSLDIGRSVARGLESRRHSLSRSIEASLVQPIMDRNPILQYTPSHAFTPKHLALDWDANFVTLLMGLRDRGDLSRETILEEADFSQDIEYRRREYEADHYDDTFQTAVPFDSPANAKGGGVANKPATPKNTTTSKTPGSGTAKPK